MIHSRLSWYNFERNSFFTFPRETFRLTTGFSRHCTILLFAIPISQRFQRTRSFYIAFVFWHFALWLFFIPLFKKRVSVFFFFSLTSFRRVFFFFLSLYLLKNRNDLSFVLSYPGCFFAVTCVSFVFSSFSRSWFFFFEKTWRILLYHSFFSTEKKFLLLATISTLRIEKKNEKRRLLLPV